MTALTDTQLAEINERLWAYDTVGQSTDEFERHAFTDMALLMGHISELNRQLSTIRKEATDAEREACAKIADVTKGAAVYAFWSGERACHSVAESIRARSNLPRSRAPTGDEGK